MRAPRRVPAPGEAFVAPRRPSEAPPSSKALPLGADSGRACDGEAARILEARGAGKTCCRRRPGAAPFHPREAPRRLATAACDWRSWMPASHAAVRDLVGRGRVVVTQKGSVVDVLVHATVDAGLTGCDSCRREYRSTNGDDYRHQEALWARGRSDFKRRCDVTSSRLGLVAYSLPKTGGASFTLEDCCLLAGTHTLSPSQFVFGIAKDRGAWRAESA